MAEIWKETFNITGTNVQLNATADVAYQDQTNALKHNNLPHNAFVVSNTNATATLFIFLDNFSNENTPDYVLFPNQTIAVGVEDGVSFTTLWLKNTHATENILANEIKYKISTIKRKVV
tara:strand:+ start:4141 stop:4497 length:357 start_codon:yes stop_codon:yes gene_type:complete